jgi:thiol-disulfide isomerase/thioredoxin
MKKLHLFLSLMFVLSQACKHDESSNVDRSEKTNDEKTEIAFKDTLLSHKNIVISSVTDDPNALGHVYFMNYSYFNTTDYDGFSEEKMNDNVKFTLDKINQPQILEVFSFGDSTNYNTRMFVSPGDSIIMSVKKGIHFIGKNAAHYNFFVALDSQNDTWGMNPFKGNLKDYKRKSRAIFEERKQFFNRYIAENEVSEGFIKQVGNELKFEYLYNLMAPRSIPVEGMNGFANNPDFFDVISSGSYNYREGFPDLKSYFEPMAVSDFNKLELMNSDYFKRSLVSYIRYYFTGHEYLSYSLDNFKDEKTFIEENFMGTIREYALTRLIYDYYQKGLGQGKNEKQIVEKFLQEQISKVSNLSYKEELLRIKEDLALSGFTLPEKVIFDQFTTTRNDTIILSNILKNAKNKIRVLDFWASWCAPCISEMKKTVELRNDLKNSGDLEWIFISIDYNKNNWLKSIEELKPFLADEPQYSMLNIENSEILRYLTKGKRETFMIPRYVIIGPNDEVISSSAPRPTDTNAFVKIISQLRSD